MNYSAYQIACRRERIKGKILAFIIGGGIASGMVLTGMQGRIITGVIGFVAFLLVGTLYDEGSIQYRVYMKQERRLRRNEDRSL